MLLQHRILADHTMVHQILGAPTMVQFFWYCESLQLEIPCHASDVIDNGCCKGGRVIRPPFNPWLQPFALLARFDGDAR